MTEHEQRQAAYAEHVRAKYNAAQLKALKAKGHTFPGSTSYPIDDLDDLDKAIKAVGRGNADHDAIRKYIIARASDMGLSKLIPEDWNSDGSLKTSNSAEFDSAQEREVIEAITELRATWEAAGRNDPTPEDWDISYGLSNVKASLARVKAAQLADPDYKTDPDDQAVMAAIEKAEGAIDKAIIAQSKDSHADKPQANSANWATPKMAVRAFSSLVEWPSACEGEIQVRGADADSPVAHFRGYASTTGVPYSVRDWLGEYQETMAPGSFSKTLREQENVPLLFDHGGLPLASTASGTSSLAEDKRGLCNDADLDRRDALSNSVCVQLSRGVLNKMSFSFRGVKEDWNDAYDQRTVTECALFDTSIVTYPANPTTSGELVEAMRSAMGREGRSLWLADSELSVRSALPVVIESRELPEDGEDLIERALRALAHADEVVCRSRGSNQGRARTFLVAQALGEIRAGKALSAKNHALLSQALDALSAADKNHQKVAQQHQTAAGKLSDVLNPQEGSAGAQDGKSNSNPPPNGDPVLPQDGAGPRSLPAAVVQARRQVERLKRG